MAWASVDEVDEPALYGTDEFRIQIMKVLRCSKKYCHDWTRCPFAHPGEKATRRDPTAGTYTGIACPEMRRDQRCPRGHYCPYAHNVFEYWLHPTRYRTALCRDMEKCNRKICFFAHNMHELRSNLERPYVSPEQLLAATQAAANDPSVQARYLAAAQEKSSKSMFHGIGDEDTGQTLEQLQNMSSLASLSLPAPRPSSQRVETMNALSSIIRGSPESSTNALMTGDSEAQEAANLPRLPSLTASKIAPRPATSGQQNELQASPQRRNSETGSQRKVSGLGAQRKYSSETGSRPADPTQAEPGQGLRGFGPRGNSLGAVHSWGSQQNLLNATAQLSEEKAGKESVLWSTPRTPFDFNNLYSTASTQSDRTPMDTGSHRNLEMLNANRTKRRPTRQQSDNSSMGQSSLYSQGPNMIYTGGSYPSMPLYTGSSASTFSGSRLGGGIGQNQGLFSGGYQSEYAQMMQREQVLQQQNLIALQRRQQQQQAYEQQVQAQLQQQNFGRTINPHAPLGDSYGHHDFGPQRAATESGFDLRFGGLGESKGLLTRALGDSAPPQGLNEQLNSLYSESDMHVMLQNSAILSRGFSGSLDRSSLLQALQAQQAQSFRGTQENASGHVPQMSQEHLPLDLDLEQRLRFGTQEHPGPGPTRP